MRHKDPELMKKISRFVENFYGSRSRMPSTAEIAGEMHVAKSTAYNYLVAMDKEGMLTYRNGEILRYCNKAVYGDKKILVKTLVSQGVVSYVIKKK